MTYFAMAGLAIILIALNLLAPKLAARSVHDADDDFSSRQW